MLFPRLLVVVLLLAAMAAETFAARRCGLVARWRAARHSAFHKATERPLATPQAAFDAYCRAVVGSDGGDLYDVMSRDSQDIALVHAAFNWALFVGDYYRDDAELLPACDEFQRRHGLNYIEWVREAVKIDARDGELGLSFGPDQKPVTRAECAEMVKPIRRQLRDPRAFYVESMQRFWLVSAHEGDFEREQALAKAIEVPIVRNLKYAGRHARGVVSPSKSYDIHFPNDIPDQVVTFTFERGGWRIEIPTQ